MKDFIEILFFWIAGKPVPFFANRKKSKREFLLLWKKAKSEKRIQHLFAASCYGGSAKVLPWDLHSSSQHQTIIVLNCVCEHL